MMLHMVGLHEQAEALAREAADGVEAIAAQSTQPQPSKWKRVKAKVKAAAPSRSAARQQPGAAGRRR